MRYCCVHKVLFIFIPRIPLFKWTKFLGYTVVKIVELTFCVLIQIVCIMKIEEDFWDILYHEAEIVYLEPFLVTYCMSKKSCPLLYSDSQLDIFFDILSIQEVLTHFTQCMSLRNVHLLYIVTSRGYRNPYRRVQDFSNQNQRFATKPFRKSTTLLKVQHF